MNIRFHKSLLAGAIAAALATPVWSAGTQSQEEGSQSGASSQQYGQSEYQGSQGSSQTTGRSDIGSEEQQGLSGTGSSSMSGTSSTSGTSGSSSLSSSAGVTSGADNPLHQKTPDELEGMKVVGADNEQIGEIEKVVRSRQDDRIFAVVSFGGMLGMGEKEVVVPLDDLQQGQNDQQLQISQSKDQLKAGEQYSEDQYVELEPKDRPISEFARFEVLPGSGAGQSGSGTMEPESERRQFGSDIESRPGPSSSGQGIESEE